MSNQAARINMIKQQLRTGDVLDNTILDLYEAIPRDQFVPDSFKNFAYSDMQISLDHGQRMMTPLEEGLLLQALSLKGNEYVLEIGTGSGFLTALLSRLCKTVISLDYFADFTNRAARKLALFNCNNVELITADASQGFLDKAPYDVIVSTCSIEQLTETQKLQVLPGGKLFTILGKGAATKAQLFRLNHNGIWQTEILYETSLPALIDQAKQNNFVF